MKPRFLGLLLICCTATASASYTAHAAAKKTTRRTDATTPKACVASAARLITKQVLANAPLLRKFSISAAGDLLQASYLKYNTDLPSNLISYSLPAGQDTDHVTYEVPTASGVFAPTDAVRPINTRRRLDELGNSVQRFGVTMSEVFTAGDRSFEPTNRQVFLPVAAPYRVTIITTKGEKLTTWGSVMEAPDAEPTKNFYGAIVKRSGEAAPMVNPVDLIQHRNLLVSLPVEDELGRSFSYLLAVGALPPGARVTGLTSWDKSFRMPGQEDDPGRISLSGSFAAQIAGTGCNGEICLKLAMPIPIGLGDDDEALETPSGRSSLGEISFRLPKASLVEEKEPVITLQIADRTIPLYRVTDYPGSSLQVMSQVSARETKYY